MLRSVIWVLLAFSGKGMGFHTDAVCSTMNGESWTWMDNVQQKSPCLTAAFVIGPCVSSVYDVTALDGTNHYSLNETTVNICTCSWAVYNLLSACTLCQGFQNSTSSWVEWSQFCGNLISNARPYPSNTPIPQNVTFPNWAAKDPTSWPDERFDGDMAHEYEMEHPGDWIDPSNASNKGRNIGAIIGGVVGGVVILGFGIAVALCLYRRNKRQLKTQQAQNRRQTTMTVPFNQHAPNPSDLSSSRMGLIYSPLVSSSSPSSGLVSRYLSSPATLYTHNSSRISLPESSIPSHTNTFPYQGNALEAASDTISPYMLQTSSSQDVKPSSHGRKMSEASMQLEGNRGPMNPPAYSGPSAIMAPQNPDSSGLPHEKRQSSSGTAISQSTNMSMGSTMWSQDAPTSLDGAVELIGVMNTLPAPLEAIPAYSGPTPSAITRDEKRRPTITVMNQE